MISEDFKGSASLPFPVWGVTEHQLEDPQTDEEVPFTG